MKKGVLVCSNGYIKIPKYPVIGATYKQQKSTSHISVVRESRPGHQQIWGPVRTLSRSQACSHLRGPVWRKERKSSQAYLSKGADATQRDPLGGGGTSGPVESEAPPPSTVTLVKTSKYEHG